MEDKIALAVRNMAELYWEITRSKYNPSELFLLDSHGKVRDFEGKVLDIHNYESLKGILELIKKNPRRARNFPLQFPDEKIELIYIPDQTVSPENYTSDGYLKFEAAIDVFEETFHALDDIQGDSLRNKAAREAFAVLARYIGMRYLEKEGCPVPINSLEDVIYYSMGTSIVEIPGDSNDYLNVYSYEFLPEKEYIPRLYLIGLIKSLENMNFKDAFEEIKRIYQSAKHSKDPLKIVEQQGLKYSTVPSKELLEIFYN